MAFEQAEREARRIAPKCHRAGADALAQILGERPLVLYGHPIMTWPQYRQVLAHCGLPVPPMEAEPGIPPAPPGRRRTVSKWGMLYEIARRMAEDEAPQAGRDGG